MANMQEVTCKNCDQVQRVEYVVADLGGSLPKFCSYCGSAEVEKTRIDSYWYELAESYGFPRSAKSAELVQGLYRLWEPTEFPRFRQFVESVKEAVN